MCQSSFNAFLYSCTRISSNLVDIKDGDEIIMPNFTFSSTANAFAKGAKIVFIDVEPETMNVNIQLIEPAITKYKLSFGPLCGSGL